MPELTFRCTVLRKFLCWLGFHSYRLWAVEKMSWAYDKGFQCKHCGKFKWEIQVIPNPWLGEY